jgi:hypothetical protein
VDAEPDRSGREFEQTSRLHPPEVEAPERVPQPSTPLERTASALGNRGFSGLLSRMADGEGILAGGLVHPDVEAAIAASRGSGGRLDRGLSRQLEHTMDDSLQDVRVHTDDHAAALARAVSARAFTVGSDIFFGSGEYSPGNRDGAELIAHEVTHVVQQRGAPIAGPLTVSQPGDALEREADALARDVTG